MFAAEPCRVCGVFFTDCECDIEVGVFGDLGTSMPPERDGGRLPAADGGRLPAADGGRTPVTLGGRRPMEEPGLRGGVISPERGGVCVPEIEPRAGV